MKCRPSFLTFCRRQQAADKKGGANGEQLLLLCRPVFDGVRWCSMVADGFCRWWLGDVATDGFWWAAGWSVAVGTPQLLFSVHYHDIVVVNFKL